MKREDVPAKYRPKYDRAMSGRSPKSGIRLFCLECVGWSEKEVRLCTARDCSLFLYRQPPSKRGRSELEGDETTSVDRLHSAEV